jgi:hypothetical protein
MNLNKYSLRIGNNTIVVKCAAHLREQAESLLQIFNRLQPEGKALDSGLKKQIGWSTLTLFKRGTELLVCEPDFWGDPFNNIREDLTCTLTILAKQNKLLSILGIEGVSTTFREKISLAGNSLDTRKIYLKRDRPKSDGDSGWHIDRSIDPPEMDKQDFIYTYQLLDSRPELLQVLSLPPGYLVIFDGDGIDSIINDKGENVWNITNQPISSYKEQLDELLQNRQAKS